MNTLQLNDCLRANKWTQKIYRGTYAADLIPKRKIIKNKPEFYVVNLDDSNLPGSHWIGIYLTATKIEIFDSGGRKLLDQNHYLALFRKYHKEKKFVYNNRQIQAFTSEMCAQFVCLFALAKAKKISLKQFLNCFLFVPKNLKNNDFIATQLFNKYFKCNSDGCIQVCNENKCIQVCNNLKNSI